MPNLVYILFVNYMIRFSEPTSMAAETLNR